MIHSPAPAGAPPTAQCGAPGPAGTSPAGQPCPPAADNVPVPAQDRCWSHDQPQPGQAPGRQCPGEQRQPRPVWPRQPRMSPRLLAQGNSELTAQHQDLGVLPARLPPRQAQHRHGPGDDEEDQLQACKPKIIARQLEPARPPGTVRVTEPTASREHLPRWRRFSAPTSGVPGVPVATTTPEAAPADGTGPAGRSGFPPASPGHG